MYVDAVCSRSWELVVELRIDFAAAKGSVWQYRTLWNRVFLLTSTRL
jgi:hypothetical protein